MSNPGNTPAPDPRDGVIRPHVYDGIQEFDKRLPNWWLQTLYWSIVFSVGYWFYYFHSGIPMTDQERVTAQIQKLEAIRMAAAVDPNDEEAIWKMSRNPQVVAAGKQVYLQTCASCHKPSLRGVREGGIGSDLVDSDWIHGGSPRAILTVINDGVLLKGMPAWKAVLGPTKSAQAAAYILSYHERGADGVARPPGAGIDGTLPAATTGGGN